MTGRLARIQARVRLGSLLQGRGRAGAGFPDTLRIRPTSMGWMVGWYRSDLANAINICKPPPWLASLSSRLARLPGQESWATGDGLWGAQVPLCLENTGCSHSQDQHPKSKGRMEQTEVTVRCTITLTNSFALHPQNMGESSSCLESVENGIGCAGANMAVPLPEPSTLRHGAEDMAALWELDGEVRQVPTYLPTSRFFPFQVAWCCPMESIPYFLPTYFLPGMEGVAATSWLLAREMHRPALPPVACLCHRASASLPCLPADPRPIPCTTTLQ
ncbi:uncharacterized protein BDZ83DRAFT_650693 [Colletotrichum acutatum]|uniref:Uncharacterized protein n=1 Tax=Glomerella acutata TaxID=27357 RepID=A0AAD8UNL2_GLOAC|nr:uncharacterized protein BDZ83DRAFT_650693 [Colletotrichum acutatum]KAK1726067.1 hypothetical protein BDZ83DRAFT_650693 [Colletotrichum acutatum]